MKEQKLDELKRLKALKRKEIDGKLAMIQDVAGLKNKSKEDEVMIHLAPTNPQNAQPKTAHMEWWAPVRCGFWDNPAW